MMTTNLDAKFPEVLYERGLNDKLIELVGEEWSPFKGHTMADVLIYAMGYALSHNMKPRPLGPKPMKLPPQAFDAEKRTLMRSLAIHVKNDVSVIKNNNEVITICAEYANAATTEVYNRLSNKDHSVTSENVLEEFLEECDDSCHV